MRRMQRTHLLPFLAITLIAALAGRPAAQEPDPSLTFEVASVKPAATGSGGPMMASIRPQGERFTASNLPLMFFVTTAFRFKPQQVTGLPSWAESERFDIQAKAPAGMQMSMAPEGGSALTTMLRNLLVDRFQLRTHTETRELPVYALVKARDDGKLGASLTPSRTDCESMMKAARAAGGPPPFGPPKPGERPVCGMYMTPDGVKAGGMSFATLVNVLEGQAGRIIVDRTGLTGTFDIELTFTPEFIVNRPAGGPPPQFNGQPIDPNGPTLFTALQEQLGLKLEATKAPVDVLVIDSVSRPTPD